MGPLRNLNISGSFLSLLEVEVMTTLLLKWFICVAQQETALFELAGKMLGITQGLRILKRTLSGRVSFS